ncbi:extracellular solute-binding protein [Nocardia zapadnayensis]|uniref:ABC transporter substrate-binding protein n=1 Tax=Nocardia rhamnosiphila TaxID=426716 RepID=UPI002247A4E5|nr:extracellular solute-binding protein [Nocardia zapadnayensis]MCX0275115.1 extracellular solute-binding protein [Nocardia zapadnayensis]
MKKTALFAIACAAALLTGCGTGGPGSAGPAADLDPETRALVEAAQSAGPVTIYSMLDESALRMIAEHFTDEYGIQVEPVRLVTADLIQRFSAEAESGRTAADIVLVTDSAFIGDARTKGWIAPIAQQDLPPAADTFPKEYLTHDGAAAVVSLIPSEMVVNSDEISEPPQSWEAYADPRFKGELMLTRPDTSPANLAFWSLMIERYGEDFLRKIADNEPTFSNSAVPLTQAIAAGEAEIGFPGVAAIVQNLAEQGAPVELLPLAPTTGPEATVALSEHSPNPAGAELLAGYLMSEKGNRLLNDGSDGISPYDTEGVQRFIRVGDVELADAAKINALLEVTE